MKKTSRKFKITAAILAGLLIAGFLLIFAGRPSGNRLPPIPGKGTVRSADGRRLILGDLQIEGFPAFAALPELFKDFAAYREIECSGTFPALKAPFRLKLLRGDLPEEEKLELITELHGRPLTFDATVNRRAETVRFELRGTVDHGDLANFRVKLPRGTAFEGTVQLTARGTLKSGRLAETPEIEGVFTRGSRLFLGPFRLLAGGRFELATALDGAPQLTLPEARLTLANLELGDLQFVFAGHDNVHFSGQLRPQAPLQFSRSLPFSGQCALDSGDWSIHAELAERCSITTARALVQLTDLAVNARGSAGGGSIDYHGNADSLSLRPDDGGRRLWSGTGVKLRGEIELNRNSAGQLAIKAENRIFDFAAFELSDGGRYFQAENLHLESGLRPQDESVDFRLEGANIRAEQLDEIFALEQFRAAGSIVIAAGAIVKLDKFTAGAASLRLHQPGWRFDARDLSAEGGFDRRREAPGDNLELNMLAAEIAVSDRDGNRFLAPHGAWKLGAELRTTDRRPGVWHHRFNSDAATWNQSRPQSDFTAKLTKPELALTIADAGLALQQIGLKIDRLTGNMQWKNPAPLRAGLFSRSWNFDFAELSLGLERNLDGFKGKFRLGDGALSEPDRKIELSGLALEIPFVPPASADAPVGGLAIKKVLMPQKIIQSVEGTVGGKGNVISCKGLTRSELFAGGGLFFTGKTEIQGSAWNSVTEFSMPSTMLNGELQLSELLQLPGTWRFLGRMSATGELRFGEGAPREQLMLHLSGDGADGNAAFAGLTGEIMLPDGPESRHDFSFKSFVGKDFQTGGGKLVLSGGKLAAADFAAWGGNWHLRSGRPGPEGGMLYEFEAKGITPAALIANPAWRDAVTETTLAGTVTLLVDGAGQPCLFAAELVAERAGLMRFAGLEKYRVLPGKSTDLELVEFAAAAWKQFEFKKLALKIRPGRGGMLLQVAADGRPAAPVPFVYEKNRFRRALPTEYGFDAEIEVTGDYRIPPEKK